MGDTAAQTYLNYFSQVYGVRDFIAPEPQGSTNEGPSKVTDAVASTEVARGVAFVTPALSASERELREKIWAAIGKPHGQLIELEPLQDFSPDGFEHCLVFDHDLGEQLKQQAPNVHVFASLAELQQEPALKRQVWNELQTWLKQI